MADADFGFRVFRLDASNIRAWTPQVTDLQQTLLEHQEHLLVGRTEQDVLYELLLKLGLDLCVPIQQQAIAGKAAYAVGAGVLLACLTESITPTEVEGLADGIVKWYRQLAPAGETTCLFRDSAFADDVAKTNMAAILQQHGIENVRSL
jgi:adenine-specific DNA-methyltransferase